MRTLALYINGLPVDLPGTKGLVRLTQARAALSDLAARAGEYSWPITLPDTRNNARIFGVNALHPLGLDKYRAPDSAYELRCDGELFTGTFRLTSMRGGYTGTLLGAGFAWAAPLAERKLTDLALPAVAYDGTQLETIQALDCDSTNIQFPLVSFGNFYAPAVARSQPDGSTAEESLAAQALLSHPLSVDDWLPSVYYRNVLRQIFADIGWSLSGKVLDDPRWRQALVSAAGADVTEAWPWGVLLRASATGSDSTAAHSQYMYYLAGPGGAFENSTEVFDEEGTAGNFSGTDLSGEVALFPVPVPTVLSGGTRALSGPAAKYLAPRAGQYSFAYSVEVASGHQTLQSSTPSFPTPEMVDYFSRVYLGLLVRRGGESFTAAMLSKTPVDAAVLPAYDNIAGAFDGAGNITGSHFYDGTADVYLEVGDTVQLAMMARRRLRDAAGNFTYLTRREFVVNFGAVSFACTAAEGPLLLSPAKFLPPLLQRDVVKDFLQRTNTVAVADPTRRTVALLSREELSSAAGAPLDLTPFTNPDEMEFAPAAGAGIGALVFAAAENASETLLPAESDTVRVAVGPGAGEQQLKGLFAPAAFRSFVVPQPGNASQRVPLPCLASEDALAQPLAEVDWDASREAPRLLRYLGPDATVSVPFQTRRVPLARAAWDGVLRWSGEQGAVQAYYAGTLRQMVHGHVGKAPVNLTPALYRQLTPGRRVYVAGAPYTVETVPNYDLADEAGETTLELLRDL